jgi:uncharacterized membrane protein YphA (DoxX/SURF4 family)
LLLVVSFLASGLSKVANFADGIAEMKEAGMPAPVAMAVLGAFVELAGSVLVLINRWAWLGAGMLGSFSMIGAVTAHAPWKGSGPGRKAAIGAFLMHFGMVGAFVLDALLADRAGG